jgi:vacuolar-type H+-ATPase subunit E/Vma4
LQAAHATLDQVFARALALLPSITCHESWAAVVMALADEALACVPAGACRLRCGAEMRARLEARLGNDALVTLVADDALGPGVIVESLDGTLTVDATIASRLALRRTALAIGLLNPELSDG